MGALLAVLIALATTAHAADSLVLGFQDARHVLGDSPLLHEVRGTAPRRPKPPRPTPSRPAPAPVQGRWQIIPESELWARPHNTSHHEIFKKYAVGFNDLVLKAIDATQAIVPDGGGYFMGPRATPPESPVGFSLALFGRHLLKPPRKTSFCTGASYAAFVEALNLIYGGRFPAMSEAQKEAMRMQEKDDGRRRDGVKFWGRWNADDFGVYYALIQYSGMGQVIEPEDARAGDFMTISWGSRSHSVVFLGWRVKNGKKHLLFWSSQEGTNGMGDQSVPLTSVKGVKFVRLANPDAISSFDPGPDDQPHWEKPDGTGAPPYKPAWDQVRW